MMNRCALIAALMVTVICCCTACRGDKVGDNLAEASAHVSQEVYESLPDETTYGSQGQILATGKDLIPADTVGQN